VSNSTLRGLTLEAGAQDPYSSGFAKVMVPMPDVHCQPLHQLHD
jgi:hypothetical protein